MNNKQILLSLLLIGLNTISETTFTIQEKSTKNIDATAPLKPLLNGVLGYFTWNGIATALKGGEIPRYMYNLPTLLPYRLLQGEIWHELRSETIYRGSSIAGLGLIALNTKSLQQLHNKITNRSHQFEK